MADRKARLAALKAAAGRGGGGEEDGGSDRHTQGDDNKPLVGPPSERSGASQVEKPPDPNTTSLPAREEAPDGDSPSTAAPPALRFRNYAPTSAALASSTELPAAPSGESELSAGGPRCDSAATTTTTSANNHRKRPRPGGAASSSALEAALRRAQEQQPLATSLNSSIDHMVEPDNNALTAAPRKINWDLKRDIQPKLDKLERRTQRAIVALLRERLEQEATSASAAAISSSGGLD